MRRGIGSGRRGVLFVIERDLEPLGPLGSYADIR